MNHLTKQTISIDTVQASFLFRALLNYKGKINEALEQVSNIKPELEIYSDIIKQVATYQDEITGDLCLLLTETFATDIKYLLPNS